MNNETKRRPEWPGGTWRVRIELNAPFLTAPALQYAVFSDEPVGRFMAVLTRVADAHRAQLSELDDSSQQQARRLTQLSAAWNHLFSNVPGDEVYLLKSSPEAVGLMSSKPDGQKWLVTKPVRIGSRAWTWAVPFQAVVGEEAEVTLSEGNVVDLTALDSGSRK